MRRAATGVLLALAGCSAFGSASDPAAGPSNAAPSGPNTDTSTAAEAGANDAGKDAAPIGGGGGLIAQQAVGTPCAGRSPVPSFCDDFENGFAKGTPDGAGDGTGTVVSAGTGKILSVSVPGPAAGHFFYDSSLGGSSASELVLMFDLHIDAQLVAGTELVQLVTYDNDGSLCAIQTRRTTENTLHAMEFCSKNQVETAIADVALPASSQWVNVFLDIHFDSHAVDLSVRASDGSPAATDRGSFTRMTYTDKTTLDYGVGYITGSSTVVQLDNVAAYRR